MILQCDLPEGETQIPSVLDSNILNLRWCVHNLSGIFIESVHTLPC